MERPVTSKSRGICRYYNTPRGCFAGDKCKFQHGEQEKLTPYDKNKICRYFAAGYCKRGENCWFRHIPPADPTANPSESLICAICMEEPVTFGLLADCSHIFCIDCIRNWRGQESSSDEVAFTHVQKKCPYCRTPSKFVTPSSHFYPGGHPGKAIIIERYKSSLQRIPCKYFTASSPDSRYCPFGHDCMYQHLNEDGTPYVFHKGVDHYMRQRDRRLRGLLNEVMSRSVFEYIRDIRAIFASPEPSEAESADELAFGEAEPEQGDTNSESDRYVTLPGMVNLQNLNLDIPTQDPLEDILTDFPSASTMFLATSPPGPLPVPDSVHISTSLNAEPSDSTLHSIPSNPSSADSVHCLITSLDSGFGAEPYLPDATNNSLPSDMNQDCRSPRFLNQLVPSANRTSPRQSHPDAFQSSLSDPCYPHRVTWFNSGAPISTFQVRSQRESVESHPFPPSPAPQLEAPSMTEVGANPSTQSLTGDVSEEVPDTRQQEPPFMTDGRGRVVWSRSGVKRGPSPLAIRG